MVGDWIYVFVCLGIILYVMITVILSLSPYFKSSKVVIFDVVKGQNMCLLQITFVLRAFPICPFGHFILANSFMKEVRETRLEPQMTELYTA